MKRPLQALALAAVWILVAAPAFAAPAPTYVTSDPADGATVQSPPSRVSVTFSEPLDSSSTLKVFDECGRAIDAGDEQVLGSRMDVGLAQTPSGHYTAVYVATGFAGATGQTKGSFSFHVTSGESCEGGHHDHGGGGDGNGGGHNGHGGGGGHKGHEGRDGEGDDHEDHSGTSSDDHHGSGASASHDGHSGGNAHAGEGHDRDHGKNGGKHGGHSDGSDRGEDRSNRLVAVGDRGPGLAPNGTSVLIALALSVGLGALGGWVLRVSAAN